MGKIYVTIDGKKKSFDTKEEADAFKASLPEVFKKMAVTSNEGDKDLKPKTKKELEKEAKEKAEAEAKALEEANKPAETETDPETKVE